MFDTQLKLPLWIRFRFNPISVPRFTIGSALNDLRRCIPLTARAAALRMRSSIFLDTASPRLRPAVEHGDVEAAFRSRSSLRADRGEPEDRRGTATEEVEFGFTVRAVYLKPYGGRLPARPQAMRSLMLLVVGRRYGRLYEAENFGYA